MTRILELSCRIWMSNRREGRGWAVKCVSVEGGWNTMTHTGYPCVVWKCSILVEVKVNGNLNSFIKNGKSPPSIHSIIYT